MPVRNILCGRKVNPGKVQRARELRRRGTKEEKILWQHLRAHRLGGLHFRRQQVIAGFIVDFYCHAAGLVVEVDGPIHRRQIKYDTERDLALSVRELYVLHFTNEQVREDLDGVLEQITAACQERVQSTIFSSQVPSPRGGGTGRGNLAAAGLRGLGFSASLRQKGVS